MNVSEKPVKEKNSKLEEITKLLDCMSKLWSKQFFRRSDQGLEQSGTTDHLLVAALDAGSPDRETGAEQVSDG